MAREDFFGNRPFHTQQAEKHVLRPNVGVPEAIRFFGRERECLLRVLGEGQFDRRRYLFAEQALRLDLLAKRFQRLAAKCEQ